MADLGDIGTAHVTVELDFARALSEARDLGNTIPPVDVKVDFDQTQATRDLSSTIDKAADASGPADATVAFDVADTTRKLKETLRKAAVGAEGDSSSSFTKLGSSSANGFFGGFFTKLKGLNFASRFAAVVKPVAVIGALGLITQALSSATAGVVALVGALVPLAGAMVALPAVLGAVQQGMLVTKLALAGVTDALGGLTDEIDKEKLAKLTPPAQAFVRVLDAMKPALIAFQKSLQNAAFPGFTRAVKSLGPLLAALRPGLVNTAVVMGDLAENLGRVAATMQGDLARIIASNNVTLRNLGLTAIAIGGALVSALVVARPLIDFMSRGLLAFAQNLRAATAAGRAGGGLAAFFEQTRVSLTAVFRLVSAVGGLLTTIFSGAFATGITLLDTLTRNAEEFNEELRSVDGQRGLKKFFDDALPSIFEVGRLIRDLTKGFFRLGQTKGFTKVLADVRTKLLPSLLDLVEVTTTEFLPVLIPALTEIVALFGKFAGSTGALSNIVGFVGSLAEHMNSLLANNPGLLGLLNNLLTISALGGGIALVTTAFSGLATVFGIVTTIVSSFVAVFGAVPLLLAAASVAVVVVGTKFVNALGGMLKAFFDLFVATFRTSAAFKFLGGVISAWRAGASIAIAAIRSAIGSFMMVARFNLERVGAAFTALLAGIRGFWAWWSALILRGVAAITGFVATIFRVLTGIDLTSVGMAIIGTFENGLRAGFEKVKKFILGIPKWIADNKGPISFDKKLLVPAGLAIMQGFDKGLHDRWRGVQGWVKNIGGFFKGAIDPGSLNIGDILLGKGSVTGLSNQLEKAFNIPIGALAGGPGGFLHPTSGWPDTLAQGRIIERMFGAKMGSGLRKFDTVPGAGVSQHVLGQAIDWGDASNSHSLLTRMASTLSRLVGPVFKQIIWQNSLWKGGKPGFGVVPGHRDHMHSGWQARAGGGAVAAGRPYQWNERGREMFMPQQSGYVMNAGRTKELVSALRSLSQRPASSSSQNAEIHVHSNAADPRAVAANVMANLGGVFSRA